MDTGEAHNRDALAELRHRLEAGRVARGLNQTQLARAAGLGRTTVNQALSTNAAAPSSDTVGALGQALHLDTPALLKLLDAVHGRDVTPPDVGTPGKSIGLWDPHDLEVHPAAMPPAAGSGAQTDRGGRRYGRLAVLPAYVRRAHDHALATVVSAAQYGRSGMAVLVGSSSTGKTRACWEAVQPLAAAGWRLWHPFDPTRTDAVLADIGRVAPRTVVWLNDAQQYFGVGEKTSERISAAVHSRLTDGDRGPVLILGTLWPEYADAFMALPEAGGPDSYARIRELLAGRLIELPDSFDEAAIQAAGSLAAAGDQQLAYALGHMENGRLTQFLAGVPELLRRYGSASTAVGALLHAAMDARRLGVGAHIPVAFLEHAVEGYLDDAEYDELSDDWLDLALTDVTRPVHGRYAPLRRARPRPASPTSTSPVPRTESYRLADYLEQHGRRRRARLCPPDSFWRAALDHLGPKDLANLADAARVRNRMQWAERLARQAAASGNSDALIRLAEIRGTAGATEESDRLLQRAADHGNTAAMFRLTGLRELEQQFEEAEQFARRAAESGDPSALAHLSQLREAAGKREDAEQFARDAAEAGLTSALVRLAELREQAEAHQSAERLCQLAAAAGDTSAFMRLAVMREAAGAKNGAQRLYQRAARVGNASALVRLAAQREAVGDRTGAERLAMRAADAGQSFAFVRLAEMREAAGLHAEAEKLAQKAVDSGHRFAAIRLSAIRQAAGDHEGAEHLCRLASDAGIPSAVARISEAREQAGDSEGAERLALQAAEAGNPCAVARLADLRELSGDHEGAERFAKLAADAGDTSALARIAEMREFSGDRTGAERFAQLAAEAGSTSTLVRLADIRESGGDADGAGSLLRTAADMGDTYAMGRFAILRDMAGDWREADSLARRAADAGNASALAQLLQLRKQRLEEH
ncbi:transcriptional regulator [Streptomyces sp. HUAS MG91]|uniref:Transcriptional regulator n=1 Tax=Streptomyces tabacisoli TaxID=3156398 RepID=A0AAU8J1D8_9ACTN